MQTLYLFEDEDENRFMAIITTKEFYESCVRHNLNPAGSIDIYSDLTVWPTDILFSEDMLE